MQPIVLGPSWRAVLSSGHTVLWVLALLHQELLTEHKFGICETFRNSDGTVPQSQVDIGGTSMK